MGAVNWSHPAYANRHIVARNDTEIIRASLAANYSPTRRHAHLALRRGNPHRGKGMAERSSSLHATLCGAWLLN